MYEESLGEKIFMTGVPLVFGLALLVVLLVGVMGAADFLQSVRARDAVFACEARNLEPVRKSFSTQVACRARNLGADTLTVKQVAP